MVQLWVSTIGAIRKMVYFMENPMKMNDLGVSLFQETAILMYRK